MVNKERTVYVVYIRDKGFIKKSNYSSVRSYSDDFNKARIYTALHHAKASVSENPDVIYVPVRITLDPEDMFCAILGFK